MNDDESTTDQVARRPHRFRRFATVVLVVVGCVLAPVSVLALWTKTTVLDTSNYVATVSPLAKNEDIRQAIATRVTNRVMSQGEVVSRLEAAVPPRLAGKASNLRSIVESLVHEAALKIVSSDQFATLWDEANRRVQPQVVAAFTGTTKRGASIHNDGTVTLDLSPVAKRVRARLTSLGVDVNAEVPAGRFNTTVELFKWPWLGSVQDAIDLLQQLAWLLPLLTLLSFGGAVALSTNRRRTVLRSALGVAAGMLVILVALAVGRGPYLDLFSQPEGRQAGGAAYDQLLHGLRTDARVLLIFAVVIALGAWMTGRSDDEDELSIDQPNRTDDSRRVAKARTETWVIAIALGFFALAAVEQLTAVAVLVIVLAVAVVIVLLHIVGPSRRADPSPSDDGNNTSDRDSSRTPVAGSG